MPVTILSSAYSNFFKSAVLFSNSAYNFNKVISALSFAVALLSKSVLIF